MLILNRRIGERILIDGGIVIELLEAGRFSVKLGITAPPHVKVWREEIMGCPNCGTRGRHTCSYVPAKEE